MSKYCVLYILVELFLHNSSPDIKLTRIYVLIHFAETRLDIVFVVSSCRNSSGDNFQQQLDLARNLIHLLSVDPQNLRTAIILVSNGAKIIQDLKIPSPNFTKVSLESPSSGGLCTFGQGLQAISRMFKAKGIKGVPQFLITFLAGKSSDDVSKPANNLHKAGVLVYTVGLKETINASTVSDMGSDPASEYFISFPNFTAVDSTKQALLDKLKRGLWNKIF